ncbi:TM0106 family RecB-like putative nuclease [Sinomonas halotolerans]|uniref:TM0106 family RecB-like putative nuclease n=1 Tax=Sinomonas halotolerans TaxID=1644133 RepID=A0ABU9X0S1_9MICC
MFFLEGADGARVLGYSASDLVTAAQCEFKALRILDAKLGRAEKVDVDDPMQARAARLGDVHELRVLGRFREEYGPWTPGASGGVAEIVPSEGMDRASLEGKHAESLAALAAGADVVFQASFFDGRFHGRSDFLVKDPGGRYQVFDTKLARHAKVTALLQLAAYGDQLARAGFPPSDTVTLILGTDAEESFRLPDLLPVYRERRARFEELVDRHAAQLGPAAWEADGVHACGRCEYCSAEAEAAGDVLLVAGMSVQRRKKLRADGIRTVADLAAAEPRPQDQTFERLRAQARLQSGAEAGDGGVIVPAHDDVPAHPLRYSLLPTHRIGSLPASDPGDIYFDFEGDPLWQDPTTRAWGLEYLFGVVERPQGAAGEPTFRAFLAHSLAEEKKAFEDFVDYAEARRAAYPGLHVYHYAAYEKTALRKLSVRHGVREAEIDCWLRQGLLVDLYATVRESVRISERSYSIKKLEPLYMGDNLRTGVVQTAASSVDLYEQFTQAREEADEAEAERLLRDILDYNRDDCVSTLRLDEWLRELGSAAPASVEESERAEPDLGAEIPVGAEAPLLAYLERRAERADWEPTADDTALELLAAAVRFHPREKKSFWWAHFDRLERPLDELEDQRNVMVVDRAEVVEDWAPVAKSVARTARLSGRITPGSDFRAGSKGWFRAFNQPLPLGLEPTDASGQGRNGWFDTEVLEVSHDGECDVMVIREKVSLAKGGAYPQLPVVLSEGRPFDTKSIEAAQAELATAAAAALPRMLEQPGMDILRRSAPRTPSGLPQAAAGRERWETISEAIRLLDRSYLAVQGPPGTGKTYTAGKVIAALVAEGWKVGVVANSHAVIENVLCKAVEAGVPAHLVAKKVKDGEDRATCPVPWPTENDRIEAVGALVAGEGGCLIGGTAWNLTGQHVPAGSLDLLVIDEAGQFSLANTVAVSRAASRLLLLGDPQQLPQVSQGTHPAPVDTSALGWLADGAAVLPPRFGYFLAESWRMAPELCAAVSRLAYDGKLEPARAVERRRLDGVPAGVETVFVEHEGNRTSSPEEAEEVVEQVRRHLGLRWHDGTGSRDLGPKDVLVVAAYNAQVNLIKDALEAAGHSGVRVGTVDKFQGQEAAVVVVSMGCSSPGDAPRGLEFLLNRNRINVAISRGMWRAVIVRSPQLTWTLPNRPRALEELGAFVGLTAEREHALLSAGHRGSAPS